MRTQAGGSEWFDRARTLGRLRDEHFDVLVIGGGITGAGVALDAAARGLKTALVEKRDFASGTSSESSKLVHGGLRYLQQYEIGLVFQSLAERHTLLRNAPHMVHEQVFVIPLFGEGGIVDKATARTYALGLTMYDAIGGFRIGHLHKRVGRDVVQRHLPPLQTDKLVDGFLYYDARADDARLTLEILKTAAQRGAAVVNHARVTRLLEDDFGNVRGARIAPDGEGEEFDVRATVVVSATGVWADDVRNLAATGAQTLRPAKGIHIAVPMSALPCDAAVVLPSALDKRNVFVIPWDDHTYVGTTDTEYSGSLDTPDVTPEDVDYLLAAVNGAVSKKVRREDVTGTWSGLRPLVFKTGRKAKAKPTSRTADMSRRHSVTVGDNGLVTVTGGKLTTYRKMAQDTVDTVMKRLGRGRVHCPTKHLPLAGAEGLDEMERAGTRSRLGLSPDRYEHLRRRYGSDLENVVAVMHERPEFEELLVEDFPYVKGEVVYAVRREMATDVDDVLSRRLRVLPFDNDAAQRVAPEVARLMGEELGWDAARITAEADRFVQAARAMKPDLFPPLQAVPEESSEERKAS
jgi:glycerol-3-phosphate dehydrogenase